MTVVPGTFASSAWTPGSSARGTTGTSCTETCVRAGSSVTTTTRSTFSARTWRTMLSVSSAPSMGWPPVIATASLARIL